MLTQNSQGNFELNFLLESFEFFASESLKFELQILEPTNHWQPTVICTANNHCLQCQAGS